MTRERERQAIKLFSNKKMQENLFGTIIVKFSFSIFLIPLGFFFSVLFGCCSWVAFKLHIFICSCDFPASLSHSPLRHTKKISLKLLIAVLNF